jgi:hypothetical protein
MRRWDLGFLLHNFPLPITHRKRLEQLERRRLSLPSLLHVPDCLQEETSIADLDFAVPHVFIVVIVPAPLQASLQPFLRCF